MSLVEISLIQKSVVQVGLIEESFFKFDREFGRHKLTQQKLTKCYACHANGHCHHSEHGDQTPESHQAPPLPHQKQINATKVDRDKFKRDKFDRS